MPVNHEGAQRASGRRRFQSLRFVAIAALASVMAIGGLASHPETVAAAGKKVVVDESKAAGTSVAAAAGNWAVYRDADLRSRPRTFSAPMRSFRNSSTV